MSWSRKLHGPAGTRTQDISSGGLCAIRYTTGPLEVLLILPRKL